MNKSTLFIVFAIALAIVSCGKGNGVFSNGKEAPDDSASLRIAVMPGVDCLPLFVAEERGLFEREGIVVKLVPFTAQMDVDTALVGGSVDGGVTDRFRLQHLEQQGLEYAVWAPAQTEWQLVAGKKSRLRKVGQLGGKLVAMTRGSATEHLSTEAFKALGDNQPYLVQINDVIVRTKMLNNGELDAVWLQEPQVSAVLARGGNIVADSVKREPYGQFVFRKASRYTAERGQLLKRAYDAACDSLNTNGIRAYSRELQKHCLADTAAIARLKDIKFKKL